MTELDADSERDGSDSQIRLPPYVSFKTFLTFMEDQQQHGVPSRIDRSVLTRFSGSVGTQLISAIKFLGLIDKDQKTRPVLQEYVNGFGTDVWKNELAELIKRAYGPIFEHNLEKITPAQFHDIFKAQYPAKDAVVRKCEVFFLNAVKAADLPINPRVVKYRAPVSTNGRKRQAGTSNKSEVKKTGDTKTESEAKVQGSPQSPYDLLIDILDPTAMEDEEQQAVWTLIRYLKRQEQDAD